MRTLITGASGHIGRYLLATAPAEYEITAACRQHPVPGWNQVVTIDLTDTGALKQLLSKEQPELIIHAAALPDVDRCEREPELAYRVNSEVTENLAEWTASNNARLVYLSTDLVFGGSAPPGGYPADVRPEPLSIYGKSKLAGEDAVRTIGASGMVIRCALVYGWGPAWKPPFADLFVKNLDAGRSQRVFTDQYRTTIQTDALARAIWFLVGEKKDGTWHLGGPERTSRYEFSCELARQLGADQTLIEPITMADIPGFAPRPADCSLATDELLKNIIGSDLASEISSFLTARDEGEQ